MQVRVHQGGPIYPFLKTRIVVYLLIVALPWQLFKSAGALGSTQRKEWSRQDFVIGLVLTREIYKANKGDLAGAVKEAAQGDHSMCGWGLGFHLVPVLT